MKKKNLGIELLRIVSMMMVIVLHYLDKGGILQPYRDDLQPANLFYWLVEALALVSTNVYILISGYLLADAEWKPERLFRVVGQVYFYSILIPFVMLLVGAMGADQVSLYDWIRYLFPFGQECYWYMTAYVIMIAFSPFLAAGARTLSKKQFQVALVVLLFFFSLEKTLVPVSFSTDRYGYDFGWLLCLFLVAAYMKLYGMPFLEKGSRGFWLYGASCVLLWLVGIGSGILGRWGLDTFGNYYVEMPYCHNYFLTLTGAVGLFYGFKNLHWPEPGENSRFARLVRFAGPHVLGAYLLHEHPVLQYKWPLWLRVSSQRTVPGTLVHMLICVLVILICGVLSDWLRDRVFGLIRTFFGKKKGEKNEGKMA